MAAAAPYSVLIVDDDPSLRALLVEVLEATGEFRIVAQAADGKEAIAQATRHQPDLITLDLLMPIMSGYQALRPILESCRASRVVVLSMLHGNPIQRDVMQLGADAFLDKGASDEELVQSLLDVMRAERKPRPPMLSS